MASLGLLRVAAITPKLIPANVEHNERELLNCLDTANQSGCAIALFPELCLTGATCGDLYRQALLYRKSLESLKRIVETTKNSAAAVILGHFLELGDRRFNCALFIQNGEIKGIVPKMFISAAEARWFTPGNAIPDTIQTMRLFGADIPFGTLLFQDETAGLTFGIEVGGDCRAALSPGTRLALRGAQLLFNPTAEQETAGQAEQRRIRLAADSARLVCGYVTAAAGPQESTTDAVFGGHNRIAENGAILAESSRLVSGATILCAELDYEALRAERLRHTGFADSAGGLSGADGLSGVGSLGGLGGAACGMGQTAPVFISALKTFDPQKETLFRVYPANPFLPGAPAQVAERCAEVFDIQCAGLAKRLTHTKAAKTVIGVSGGLDSTLALFVCAQAHKQIGKPSKDIVALTMPGFGTTEKTRANALALMRLLGTDAREIPIHDAILRHFADIGHDPTVHDVTYENAQARERTQILMDIANRESGLVVGTGDLSEAALGWSTFNGDHMSMYQINAGVPKTVIRHLMHWVRDATFTDAALRQPLSDILDTPISPELLPPDDSGESQQRTEDLIGPYALHDFFLYHTVRYGFAPEKLLFLAGSAFAGVFDEGSIKKWLAVFYRRFISQQFKRNCAPDGPKVFSFSLSSRGEWVAPSDADWCAWIFTEEQERSR